MNSPADDIKDILEAEDLSLTFGTNMFVNHEPKTPDNCVTVFDIPGGPPQLTTDADERYYYDSVSIRVRNTSSTAAYTVCEGIMTALHGRAQETWNGTLYTLIRCVNSPALLSWDDKQRCRWIMNFDIQRR